MRKTVFVRTLCCGVNLFCIAALGLVFVPGFAQGATTESLPSDPRAFMIQAGQSNLLSQMGDQAWHLKVTFKIFDQQGAASDQGNYEEFYVSPTKFKQSFSSNGFSQTTYGTDHGMLRSGNVGWPYALLGYLRKAYVFPSDGMAQIAQLDLVPARREIDGAKYLCIPMNTKPPSIDVEARPVATYCFEGGPDTLRIAFLNGMSGPITIIRKHPISFNGLSLPGDIELDLASKLAFSAHTEIIEPVTPADEAVFTPPPEATPFAIKMVSMKRSEPLPGPAFTPGDGKTSVSAAVAVGLLTTKIPPVYPPVAKAARVQGTVVLQALLGKDGHIKELHVVSGPPMLIQAAMDAVKQWVYKPYLVNGKPMEVQTTVNVIFALGDQPQPSQVPQAPTAR